jgi:hypothetical protein
VWVLDNFSCDESEAILAVQYFIDNMMFTEKDVIFAFENDLIDAGHLSKSVGLSLCTSIRKKLDPSLNKQKIVSLLDYCYSQC